jgi:antitoxin (DNA-binding transcriptional repressor) of toxin-antitoxin stability system
MKTATVRQLRTAFPKIERWLAGGETVSITKRRKIVAELSLPRPKAKPDFAKRFAISADDYKIRPGKTLREVLNEDRGS